MAIIAKSVRLFGRVQRKDGAAMTLITAFKETNDAALSEAVERPLR